MAPTPYVQRGPPSKEPPKDTGWWSRYVCEHVCKAYVKYRHPPSKRPRPVPRIKCAYEGWTRKKKGEQPVRARMCDVDVPRYGVWPFETPYFRGPARARKKNIVAIRRPLLHAQVTSACHSGRRFPSSFFCRAPAGPRIKSEHSVAVTLLIVPLHEWQRTDCKLTIRGQQTLPCGTRGDGYYKTRV